MATRGRPGRSTPSALRCHNAQVALHRDRWLARHVDAVATNHWAHDPYYCILVASQVRQLLPTAYGTVKLDVLGSVLLLKVYKIQVHWVTVRGHSGQHGNDKADVMLAGFVGLVAYDILQLGSTFA